MIEGLSNSVIMPIAGIIITFVLCYELISMLTERNNMHDIDTWMFFKYFVKMWIAVYLVSNTFTITMAVFDVGQNVVNSAAGLVSGDTSIDISSAITDLSATLESMEIGELVILALETLIVSFCMKIMSVLITVILYVRMIEIYLYTSVAPIPFATMSNREWGQIGTNYFRGLFALAFQAFLMMVCVAIYAVLVAGIQFSDNLSSSLFGVMAYTVILCFSLFKTGSLTKRQLICIGIGAAMGIPCYFLFRNALGINNAAVLMVLMMLPAFLFAMYEKDGMHLEDVLMHVIRVKFIRPSETENYYESDPDGEDQKTMRKEERKGGNSGGKKKKKGRK